MADKSKQSPAAEAAPAPTQAQPTTATQISEVTGLPEQTPQEAIVQGPVQVDVRGNAYSIRVFRTRA